MRNTPFQKGFTPILLLLVLVLIGGASFLVYNLVNRPQVTTPQNSVKPTLTNLPRSKAPAVVTQVALAKGVNPTTGEAVNPTTNFSKTDQAVYLVLTLNNPKVGTKFEYVRYLDGKFLDNSSLTMQKAATNNVSFNWTLKKPGTAHLTGNYKVKVYTNGVFEKEISFQVH